MSLCKKLQYAIYENKKLDWLRREHEWKFDRIDYIYWIIFISLFVSALLFGKKIVFFFIGFGFLSMFLGSVRHIKSIPGDIESAVMSPMICFGFVFAVIGFLINIVILLGKIF